VIATSEVERRQLEAANFTLPHLDIRPNPVSVSSVSTPLPSGDGALQLLFVGRICRTKGLLNLVEAVRGLDRVCLTIAGPDDGDGTMERLREAAASLPPERIEIRGWVTPEERNALIASAHICVLPSVTENFGNFAVEAASGNRPVVVTSNTGVAEFLGDAALIVEPTAEGLRAAIATLVDAPALRETLAQRGHARVQELEPERVAELQEAIYARALRREEPDGGE
jgi:glycosyltransferase involved in cell wall biosynthesis